MNAEYREFFKVGYRVRCVATGPFTGQWTPHKGICGTIVSIQGNGLRVEWDEDTLDGDWWCSFEMVMPSNV